MSAHSITSRGLAGRKIPQGTLTPIGTLLFSASEQGAWYDPSDLSTLFQDAAGTTPVTAVEQPVGRMLDKSGRGNHATQATTTKRPVYSRRANLLTYIGDPIDETWGSLPASVRYVEAPDGSITAVVPKTDAATDRWQYAINAGTYPNGTKLTYSFYKKTVPSSGISGQSLGIYNLAGLSVISITESQPDSKGFTRVSVVLSVTDSAVQQLIRLYLSGVVGADDIAVWGHQLDIGEVATTYQRIYSATDYDADPSKFPAYLRFDGVDDALQTGNIDFTSTDKMTVWAGVTKLSDVNASALLELSPNSSTSAGAIMLRAVDYPGAQEFTAYLRGSAAYAGCVAGAAASPATKVMTGLFNTSAPTGQQVTARLNGITGMQITTDAGGGMLGNYPLYIGARNQSAFYFNGRLYSLIVRGAQSSLSQIEATELYIKQKMRMP